jgi:hypothetical protein
MSKRYSKPEGFKGRGEGSTNWKKYKWYVTVYDKNTDSFRTGKFSSIKEINEKMKLNLTVDICWRLRTLNRVDTSKRNKENSFLSRYGHIKLEKIDEWKEGVHHNTRASEKTNFTKEVSFPKSLDDVDSDDD